MANHRQANVVFVDTSADFSDIRGTCGIRYVGGAGAAATIKSENSSGDALWEANGDYEAFEEVELRDAKGLRVEVSGGAKVYLYV